MFVIPLQNSSHILISWLIISFDENVIIFAIGSDYGKDNIAWIIILEKAFSVAISMQRICFDF